MKDLCSFCKYQDHDDGSGGTDCRKAGTRYNPGYGTFYVGATCINDNRLSDRFEAANPQDPESSITHMSRWVEKLRLELSVEKDKVLILRDRLGHVDGEAGI